MLSLKCHDAVAVLDCSPQTLRHGEHETALANLAGVVVQAVYEVMAAAILLLTQVDSSAAYGSILG